MKYLFFTPLRDQIAFRQALATVDSLPRSRQSFLRSLGLTSWQFWHQKLKGGVDARIVDACIHRLVFEKESSKFLQVFQDQIAHKVGYAMAIAHFCDFGHGIKSEKILELEFYPLKETRSTLYPDCHMLPLLAKMADKQKKYCQLAVEEKKELTTAICQRFGLAYMDKWLQKSALGDFVLYDQLHTVPHAASRENYLRLKSDPEALLATQSLREQTGLSFEELSPITECLYRLES